LRLVTYLSASGSFRLTPVYKAEIQTNKGRKPEMYLLGYTNSRLG